VKRICVVSRSSQLNVVVHHLDRLIAVLKGNVALSIQGIGEKRIEVGGEQPSSVNIIKGVCSL
jgi:hypothetical protein